MKANKILITKTADESTEIQDAVERAGFEPLAEPMLEIEYTEEGWPYVGHNDPLIFTSAHGVEAYALYNEGRANPVYTVGRSTAEAARSLGFTNIKDAAGTVEDLADLLSAVPEKDLISAIYVRAEDISQDLRQILIKKGVSIAEFTGYRAIPAENLSVGLLKTLDSREIYAVMLFSVRGAKVFAELVEQYDRTSRLKVTKALCISDGVLKSVSVLPFQQTLVARTPDRYGMMELLESISVTKK